MIKLWFKVVPATLAAFIGAAFLQNSLEAHPGYRSFTTSAARAGWVILICAVCVFVADLAALVVYAIRNGQSDDQSGASGESGPLPMSLDPARMGRSRRKAVKSKSEFVSMESLVNGSATFGERMMALGICIALASFFSIFLGAGLMLMRQLVIMILMPVVPGVLFFKGALSAWTDYREAKAKFQARRAAHGSSATNSPLS